MQGHITHNRDRKRPAFSTVPTAGARMESFTPGGFTAIRSGAVSVKEGMKWRNGKYFE